ncbi:MAG: HzsA-related protein [Pirellulaceae bacterium]
MSIARTCSAILLLSILRQSLLAGDDLDAPIDRQSIAAYWSLDQAQDGGTTIVDHITGDKGQLLQGVTGPEAGLPVGAERDASISLWFKPSESAAPVVLFGYGRTEQGQARGLWMPRTGRLSFFHWGGPDLEVDIPNFQPGQWYHAVCVYDAQARAMRLYINGQCAGEMTAHPDTQPGAGYRMGINLNGSFSYRGALDEVAVFTAALDADAIAWLYQRGRLQSLRDIVGAGVAAIPHASEEVVEAPTRTIADCLRPSVRVEQDSTTPGHGCLQFGAPQSDTDALRSALIRELGVEEIVFAARQADTDPHWYANFGHHVVYSEQTYYHNGGALLKLNLKTGQIEVLLEDRQGGVRDPQLHYNGCRILFSYRRANEPYYHLYEINTDGTDLRQLTDGPYDDLEPSYLPDGGIIFCSSRCNRWVPCYVTQVAVLFRCDGNGRNIRQLSSNTEQENTPWVLPDGRILYQRWEYVDRSQVGYHHLWTMNPDGTGQMVFYGNQRPDTVMIDAKPILGTGQVVASFSPGHGQTEHNGWITLIDPSRGPDDPVAAIPVTAEPAYRDPYPLTEDLFLAARDREIVLLNRQGRTASLARLPEPFCFERMALHEPRPVVARPRERVIPTRVDPSRGTGYAVVMDVYRGRNMHGLKRGEIKELLILEILSKPYNMFSGMEPLTFGGTFLLERVVGTVPVEPDGSAYMELPAQRPFFFVALDENGLAVKRMQSFFSVQPGETVSCVGCHEHRSETLQPATALAAMKRPPSPITPIAQVPDVFDFPRDIQPILDRDCVACHDYRPTERGGPMAGGIILAGDHGPMYSHSYYMLTISGQFVDGRNLRQSNYPPRSIGSSASLLMRKVNGEHYQVRLNADDKRMLRLWIDTGAPYAGTYAALGTGSIGDFSHGQGGNTSRPDLAWESARRAQAVIHARCQGCHPLADSPSDNQGRNPWSEGWMNQLTGGRSGRWLPEFRYDRHAIFNLSRPELSLVLLAPLSRTAGGMQICRPAGDDTDRNGDVQARILAEDGPPIFASTDDGDYQLLLAALYDAKRHLEQIKRFDMPGFRPRAEYVREMRRYGVLSPGPLDPEHPMDVYQLDRAYWEFLQRAASAGSSDAADERQP